MGLKSKYAIAKSAKVGEHCICPSCNTGFIKENYQQAFCKTKPGTQCKDYYWNNVTPEKRNNTTRISPASKIWSNKKRKREYNPDNNTHPHDTDALGQWDD